MLEWDAAKRETNIAKHGLDFILAGLVFDGRPMLTVPASSGIEERMLSVAIVDEVFVAAVWTWRGKNRRIISLRRARRGERERYRELLG